MSSLLKILRLKTVLAAILLLYVSLPIHAETFPSNTKYEVCFTPGGDCTSMIVDEINKANKSIYLQAYSFTSKPIAQAITDAKRKGIDIKVILDKSQVKHNKYSSAKYLTNQKVPVWVDYRPAIAHNKIVIIDNNTVITGSFNFTKAAQDKNAENVLIIHDAILANQYTQNLVKRQSMSLKLT
jgi:phosphatidylserine/phosphatidylglycerophosphate/cardiolipin synthase-like enzyme